MESKEEQREVLALPSSLKCHSLFGQWLRGRMATSTIDLASQKLTQSAKGDPLRARKSFVYLYSRHRGHMDKRGHTPWSAHTLTYRRHAERSAEHSAARRHRHPRARREARRGPRARFGQKLGPRGTPYRASRKRRDQLRRAPRAAVDVGNFMGVIEERPCPRTASIGISTEIAREVHASARTARAMSTRSLTRSGARNACKRTKSVGEGKERARLPAGTQLQRGGRPDRGQMCVAPRSLTSSETHRR